MLRARSLLLVHRGIREILPGAHVLEAGIWTTSGGKPQIDDYRAALRRSSFLTTNSQFMPRPVLGD
jgi:hypothetical protein